MTEFVYLSKISFLYKIKKGSGYGFRENGGSTSHWFSFFVFYFCNKFLIIFWVEICVLWLLGLVGGCLD